MTTASFTDIRKKIQKNIDQSKDNILVSVAWLTSKELLGQLIDKLESSCKVEIHISDHFENQRLTYDKFIEKGGQVFIVPTKVVSSYTTSLQYLTAQDLLQAHIAGLIQQNSSTTSL